jgi:hypothetical protein
MKRLSIIALLLCAPAFSQSVPTVALTPSLGTGTGVTPILTWVSTPAAASCVGSGDAAWNGTKAASGTQTLAKITTGKTYTITCSWPGDQTATLDWAAPTTNVDGSPLTNLAGFKIYQGTSAATLTGVTDVPGATTVTKVITGLPVGTRFFGLTAYNTLGVEGPFSNTVSKAIVAAASATDSASITFPGTTTLSVK